MLLVFWCFLIFLQYQKALTLKMWLRAHMSIWTHCWTSFLQKHFCTGIGRHHFEEVLCLSSCACRKEKESGAIVPQALTCLQLIIFPSKWGFAPGIPNCTTLVTQEGPGIAKFQHSCFVLYRISLRFWSLYPRQGCRLAPFSFRPLYYYSFSAPVYFVVMQTRIKWATTVLMSNHRFTHMPVTAFKATLKGYMSNSLGAVWCNLSSVRRWGFPSSWEAWYRAVGSVAWSLAIPVWPFLIVFMLSVISSLQRRGTWVRFFWGAGICSIGMR